MKRHVCNVRTRSYSVLASLQRECPTANILMAVIKVFEFIYENMHNIQFIILMCQRQQKMRRKMQVYIY